MKLNSKKGSALVVILIIAVGTGLVLSSLSQYAIQEMRQNQDARIFLEAKNAAEAAVEHGFAQLVKRFEEKNAFPTDALSPTRGDPLRFGDSFYDLFKGGAGLSSTNISVPKYPYDPTIDWNDQATEIIGGVIPPGSWKFIDSRVPGNEFDPLRDKMVFIREIAIVGKATATVPGSNRIIKAHVGQSLQIRDAPLFAHAIFYNMDMEIAPGPKMDIRGAVHANGDMYIQANSGLNFFQNVSSIGDIFHGPFPDIPKGTAGGDVTFSDGLGSQKSMKVNGSWLDSDDSDFRSKASNRWNGNVQSAQHGVQTHNPVAIDPYLRDDPATGTVDDQLNYAYQLIQPTMNKNDSDYRKEVEEQKYAYKAGLVIDVSVNPLFSSYNAYSYERDSDGNLKYDVVGNPIRRNLNVDPSIVDIDEYSASGSDVTNGLYDKRMRDGINTVEIDMARLKERIEDNDESDWGGSSTQKPEEWWNGIVYVKLPTKGHSGAKDKVDPAIDNWGVKLLNGGGSGGGIPNPSYGWSKNIYGTSLATNAPMYIQGHYNSDGDDDTGSANDPDKDDVKDEPPAALIADAITILSEDWDDEDSIKSRGNRKANSFTEVSAAILTGLVPSDKKNGNNYSGGVENFPRFLEDWGWLRYRGSMVALFESEVATEPWGKSDVYGPPRRDWGFHTLFSEGYYPPGTPNTRTFRRVNYRNLTEGEYVQILDEMDSHLN